MGTILGELTEHRAAMVEDLMALVSMDTPTECKSSVDTAGRWLCRRFEELGASVSTVPSDRFGDIVLARWGEGQKSILILGHMDSPWPLGEAKRRPPTVKDGVLFGPAAAVMKGGLVQLLHALKVVRNRKMGSVPITVLLTPDHEAGAEGSRATLMSEARRSAFALSLQPASPPHGPLKTARKGLGMYTVSVRGRAAHAGAFPEDGRSAIDELADLILRLNDIADAAAGITVNVGVVRGGSRPNVIADFARAEVDVRFWTLRDGLRVDQAIRTLSPSRDGVQIEVSGGINRPPMEHTDGGKRLFQLAQKCAAELGLKLGGEAVPGASDANFVAAEGVPTLDGLGAVGAGAYTLEEWVDVERMPERAALLALLLLSLISRQL